MVFLFAVLQAVFFNQRLIPGAVPVPLQVRKATKRW